MKRVAATLLVLVLAFVPAARAQQSTLLDARAAFETKLVRSERHADPLEPPPAELFSIVHYPTPIGPMSAYLGKPARPGGKSPAILWITGGFHPGGVDSSAWSPPDLENEQSAQAYRHAGIVLMYPTMRGSFGNPGAQESFFGEVDDVLAALEYLSKVDGVDPGRIYLGGHSTGGTLALLVAAATDRFRAVFAFGPVGDPAGYGADNLTYDPDEKRENQLRSPIHFLASIRSRTFVIEGTGGNIESLRDLERVSRNDALRFLAVDGVDHFEVLGPVNDLIAGKIAGGGDFDLDAEELAGACRAARLEARRAEVGQALEALRAKGFDLEVEHPVRYALLSWTHDGLDSAAKEAAKAGFEPGEIDRTENDEGKTYFLLVLTRAMVPRDEEALVAGLSSAADLADRHDVGLGGWWVDEE